MTSWNVARQAPLSIISWSLLKFMFFESVRLSNYLILCLPLLILPSIFLSIRVFSNELALHTKSPKYWRFSFSNSPSNEYSGWTSFRFYLLAVQGTLKRRKEVEEPFLFGQTKKGIMEEEVFPLTGGQRNSDEPRWGGVCSLRGGGGQAVW